MEKEEGVNVNVMEVERKSANQCDDCEGVR